MNEKSKFLLLALLIIITGILLAQEKEFEFPMLKGPYLGQRPPGLTPKLFAPGIITTDVSEGCLGWGNEMEYFIFQRWIDGKSQLYILNQRNGKWSAPELLPFAEQYQVGDYTIAPDGKTMVFASRLLIDEIGPDSDGANIWIEDLVDMGIRIYICRNLLMANISPRLISAQSSTPSITNGIHTPHPMKVI